MEPRRYYGHFLGAPGKNDHTFSCNETLVNKFSKCFRPTGDRINGAPLYWKTNSLCFLRKYPTAVSFERSEEVRRGSKVRTTFNMSPY